MNPFPLSSSDASQFLSDVGSVVYNLPSWGGIIQWRSRYVLVFQKVDGSFALTDISSGVPTAHGTVPVNVLLADIPRVETPTWQVFLYSLPGNLLDVATERASQIGAAAGTIVDNTIKPLLPDLMPLAVVAVAVLAFMYLPRAKG